MNWNKGIRQTHRWLSIAFTVIVIIVTIFAMRPEPPAEWIYYLPLPPLFLLLFTGLYLFALPYVAKGRSERRVD